MIQNVWVTNPSGDTLLLNLRTSGDDEGLVIFNVTGLGPPQATVSGQGGPGFDGVKGVSVRAGERHMDWTLAVPPGYDEETAKQKIYDYFPIKQTITLRIQTDSKDVYTTAIVEKNEYNQFAKIENAVISLYCPDPYFMDLFESTDMVYLLDDPTSINYSGDSDAGALFTLYFGGYATEVIITNSSTPNQSMTVDLTVLPNAHGEPGGKLTINTHYGEKSIVYTDPVGAETSAISGLAITEDWIRLYPGDNTIEVSATITPPGDMPDDQYLLGYWSLSEGAESDAIDSGTSGIDLVT